MPKAPQKFDKQSAITESSAFHIASMGKAPKTTITYEFKGTKYQEWTVGKLSPMQARAHIAMSLKAEGHANPKFTLGTITYGKKVVPGKESPSEWADFIADHVYNLDKYIRNAKGEFSKVAERKSVESGLKSPSKEKAAAPKTSKSFTGVEETSAPNEKEVLKDPSYFSAHNDYDVVQKTKADICSRLAKALSDNKDFNILCKDYKDYADFTDTDKSHISYVVRKLIHSWAADSADHNEFSMNCQHAAADIFGLEWPSHLSHYSQDSYEQNKKGYQAFVSEMYRQTQKDFAEKGIKEVVLWRGMGKVSDIKSLHVPSGHDGYFQELENPSLNPISSYSTSITTAVAFSTNSGYGELRALLCAKVPVSRILSTAKTGFGCLNEKEMVVIGGARSSGSQWVYSWKKDYDSITTRSEYAEYVKEASS